ncbi:MAG: hypothetical protein FJW26_21125 [Acidimicrobiia bacterium]|nr:hypothetical protein [Acidimicrobiia bacterium]
MRIDRLEAINLCFEYPKRQGFTYAGGVCTGRLTSLILVHTDTGMVGVGSAYSHPALVHQIVQGQLDPILRGEDPLQVEAIFDLEPRLYSPHEAVAEGKNVEGGPVVLVDAADCCGGGAAGDSVAVLRALIEANLRQPALVPVVDAEAAAACHEARLGAKLTTCLGHKHDPKWGSPIAVTGRVAQLVGGRFRYSGGMWNGMEADMGPSAVLEIGSVQVLVTTYSTYDWVDEQFRVAGLNPAEAKFLVVKDPMNYRLAYGRIARAVYVLNTPGPTPATEAVKKLLKKSLD